MTIAPTTMLAAWFHNLSPFALRISGDFGLRWYGLSYAMGFLVGWLLLRWLGRRGAVAIKPERAGDAILYAVVGVVVGGRLGYALVYEPSLFWTFSADPPWWGLLAINHGGMASHGGMVGVIIASAVIARKLADPEPGRKVGSVLRVLDALALITPPGLFLGRMANFVNGELLGREFAGSPSPWWTIKFPQEVLVVDSAGHQGLPVRSAAELSQIQAIIENAGIRASSFEAGYRMLLEKIQAGRHDLQAQLEPLIHARYPSQLFQGAAEGIVLGLILWGIARWPHRAGVVGCWFMVCYGIMRILTEVWRLPDSQFEVGRPMGLSRGQWLSVGMVAVGVAGLIGIMKRGGARVGGWRRRS
jgi:phosphatidylglycerol:prolipoprotein diacylglycerol transferase